MQPSKSPPTRSPSGWRDLNSRPLAPQIGGLALVGSSERRPRVLSMCDERARAPAPCIGGPKLGPGVHLVAEGSPG